MDSLSYKTISANAATVDKQWVVIDATDEVLGRLASQVAKILRGKNKPSYTPHVDCGDYVIVINADKVKLTGKKMTAKGIRGEMDGEGSVVNLFILLRYGCAVSEVAQKVQSSVCAALEGMTGFQVNAVNVHVGGISFD